MKETVFLLYFFLAILFSYLFFGDVKISINFDYYKFATFSSYPLWFIHCSIFEEKQFFEIYKFLINEKLLISYIMANLKNKIHILQNKDMMLLRTTIFEL